MSFGLILTSSSMNAGVTQKCVSNDNFQGSKADTNIWDDEKDKLVKNANDKFAENLVLYSWWKKH